MTKNCNGPLCNNKEKSEFEFSNSTRDGLCSVCKACDIERIRIQRLDATKARNKLKTPCENCGEPDKRLLEFAHKSRDDKSVCVTETTSLIRILEESKKCKILCIWCHRLETKAENDAKKKTFESPDESILSDRNICCGNTRTCHQVVRCVNSLNLNPISN